MASTIIDFNDLEERVTTLEANSGSGGDFTLPDDIKCKSLEVTNTGSRDFVSNDIYSNTIFGQNTYLADCFLYGNTIVGYESDGQYYTKGNTLIGANSTLGSGSKIDGNLFAGENTDINIHTVITGTAIIGSMPPTSCCGRSPFPNNEGLILVGSDTYSNYSVYWPTNKAAVWYGEIACSNNFDLFDAYGKSIIKDGKFAVEIQASDSVTANDENAVSSKAVVDYINGQNFATTSALTSHSNTANIHFTGNQKDQFESIIEDYDGSTSINDIVEDIEELRNSSGGEVTLPSEIECDSIKIDGNKTDWKIDTYFDLILGRSAKVTNGEQYASITLGRDSRILGGTQHGNINLGTHAEVVGGVQYGNIIGGHYVDISNNSSEQYGNIILGRGAEISNGEQNANVILGSSSTISNNTQYGNLFSGANLSITGDCTSTRNTWIICSLYATNFESQVTKRYGLTLIGTDENTPSTSNNIRYQVYWPDADDYAAEQHGSLKCKDDFNLLDKDGEYIIENGKSTALKLVTVDSESELPPEEEREDNVLYAVTESQSASILRIAPKNQLNEIDVLNARINALEKYIERTFVKNAVEEVEEIDGDSLDVIDNEYTTL